MKKLWVFLLTFSLLANLFACGYHRESAYSQKPFFNIKESQNQLSEKKIIRSITKIPSQQYEPYPEMHSIPLSAILHKDGEVIDIDIYDPRLVQLVNFLNNCLYYEKCAYLQGYLPPEALAQIQAEPFRLELTYSPCGETIFGPYESSTTLCDTIIITNSAERNSVCLINHNLQAYGGEYPILATTYTPLFLSYPWLSLFGF